MEKIKTQFSRFLRQSERSDLTIKSYLSDINGFAAWFIKTNGDELVPELITPTDLREYKIFLVETRCLKPQSVNRKLVALKAFLTWAHQAKLIKDIPHMPKLVRTLRGSGVRWHDKREQHRLLRAVEQRGNLRDIAIIKIFLNVGIRVAELCVARWTDVSITARKGKFIVRKGKGGKYREIPLNIDARRAFESLGYAEHAGSSAPVFTGQRGQLTVRGVEFIIAKYGKAAEIDEVSPHTLRHCFCKNLRDAGVDEDEVGRLAGHEDPATTRIYTKPSFSDLTEAVERIEVES